MLPEKNLTLSTSVPSFLNFQPRANPLKYYNHPMEAGQYQLQSKKFTDSSYGTKKLDTSLPLNLPLKQNESFENQQYGVAQSQISSEPNQPYKFQFKRSTLNTSRPTTKEDGINEQQRNSGGSFQIVSNNSKPQFGLASVSQQSTNNNSFIQKSNNDLRAQQLEKKVKDLQNQLKFEEKYANDMFKSLEQAQKQASTLKQEKAGLSQQLLDMSKKNQELAQRLNEYKDLCEKQRDQNQILNIEIHSKYQKIDYLQRTVELNQNQIKQLNEKINNFGVIFRNQLYEERIKELKEEIINLNSQLAQSILQKNHLIEEIRMKNDKMLSMTIDSPIKSKQPLIKSINISQKANEAINYAFEESIRAYQDEIKELKEKLDEHNDEFRKLEEEISEHKKQIDRLKQQQNIDLLRHNAEKNQLLQQKDAKLTEKTNQIKTLTNQLTMIEERYNKALKEIKEKDMFLQEHLVGRTKDLQLRQYIETIMQEYVQTFESRCSLQQKVTALEKELQSIKKQ